MYKKYLLNNIMYIKIYIYKLYYSNYVRKYLLESILKVLKVF